MTRPAAAEMNAFQLTSSLRELSQARRVDYQSLELQVAPPQIAALRILQAAHDERDPVG